jgi:hypothetical protein
MFNVNKTLYLAFGTLTGYIGHSPKSTAGRLFGLCYFLFCMLAGAQSYVELMRTYN